MFRIQRQPTETTCGPTCLHAVYNHWGDDIELSRVVAEVPALDHGGTLAVLLGCHALRRGYRATIYTYNLQTFDPTWFDDPASIPERLRLQRVAKSNDVRLTGATDAYLEFLSLGGEIRLEDLTTELLARYLDSGRPLIAGLSSTYLYRGKREWGPTDIPDDIRGQPQGHFVVLVNHDQDSLDIRIADPYAPNPVSIDRLYEVALDRVICSVMLGILTYDANLLLIEPAEAPLDSPSSETDLSSNASDAHSHET